MDYPFFDKVRQQADLKDFCQYLEEPLKVLQELRLLCAKQPLLLELSHRIERLLEKVLPELVDDYCNHSLAWRNTHKLHGAYTAKELLLQSLGKIMEEVKFIESSFNEANSLKLLGHHRYIQSWAEHGNDEREHIAGSLPAQTAKDSNKETSHLERENYKRTSFDQEAPQSSTVKQKLIFGLILASLAVAAYGVVEQLSEMNQKNANRHFFGYLPRVASTVGQFVSYVGSNENETLSTINTKSLQLIGAVPYHFKAPWGEEVAISAQNTGKDKFSIAVKMPARVDSEFCSYFSQYKNIWAYDSPIHKIAFNDEVFSANIPDKDMLHRVCLQSGGKQIRFVY